MSERLKEHDWKSCVLAKTGTEGSNPSLSAIERPIGAKWRIRQFHRLLSGRALRNVNVTNPVRSGRKQR